MMIRHPLLADLPGLRHGFFTRQGGYSTGLYASCNVGLGSADDRDTVLANRGACMERLVPAHPPAPARPPVPTHPPVLATCYQVHSCDVVVVGPAGLPEPPKADGMVTASPGVALGVLSADCAPLLFADAPAGIIGAAHAGWKGALGKIALGVIDEMEQLGAARERIHAVIGPCITQESYQVGPEYRARFVEDNPAHADFFRQDDEAGKFRFDLPGFLLDQLAGAGIAAWAFEGSDTRTDGARFFSYRRSVLDGEADYGRGLSAIILL